MVDCPNCGVERKHIGKHFRGCGYPELDESTKELLEALLVGDGGIEKQEGQNGRFLFSNTQKEYVDYVDEKLPSWLVSNRYNHENNGMSRVYRLKTIAHPHFNELHERFYYDGSGHKKIPRDFKLSPVKLRHWVACDASFTQNQGSENAKYRYTMGIKTSRYDDEFLEEMFDEIGICASCTTRAIQIRTMDTSKMVEYMGKEPIPGYEYKWPNDPLEHKDL